MQKGPSSHPVVWPIIRQTPYPGPWASKQEERLGLAASPIFDQLSFFTFLFTQSPDPLNPFRSTLWCCHLAGGDLSPFIHIKRLSIPSDQEPHKESEKIVKPKPQTYTCGPVKTTISLLNVGRRADGIDDLGHGIEVMTNPDIALNLKVVAFIGTQDI